MSSSRVQRFRQKGIDYAYLRPSREHAALGLKRCRLLSDQADQQAKAIVDEFQRKIDEGVLLNISEHAAVMWRAAKSRASGRDLPFDVTPEWIRARLIAISYRCEVSGLPFDMSRLQHARNGPFRPSLDRLKPSLGYRSDNLRVVCVAVNAALGEWGDEVFFRVVAATAGRASRLASDQTTNEKTVKPEQAQKSEPTKSGS